MKFVSIEKKNHTFSLNNKQNLKYCSSKKLYILFYRLKNVFNKTVVCTLNLCFTLKNTYINITNVGYKKLV